ncbi:MAG: SufD family Fe-S cluster assembly protein [Victivallaceae bacterium]
MKNRYSDVMGCIPWVATLEATEANALTSKVVSLCGELSRLCDESQFRCVLINGVYDSVSSRLPEGVTVMSRRKASSRYKYFFTEKPGDSIESPFIKFHKNRDNDGLFLYFHDSAKVFDIEVINSYSDPREVHHPGLCIVVGRNCEVRMTLRTLGCRGLETGRINGKIDYFIQEGGTCSVKVMGSRQCREEIWTFISELMTDSYHKTELFPSKGSQGLVFYDCHTMLRGDRAESKITLKGSLIERNRLFINIFMKHMSRETVSRQDIRTILEDRSEVVFRGGIYVDVPAELTRAYQKHDSLVLSDEALVETQPSLEIFSDNVKASHGATIGGFEEPVITYLSARGLSRRVIVELLKEAFLNGVTAEDECEA